MDENSPDFEKFQKWYEDNLELAENLTDYLFQLYASRTDRARKMVQVEIAELTLYLELFYLSSLEGNRYNFKTSREQLRDILLTSDQVVDVALKSLEEHGALKYVENGNELEIKLAPISAPHQHH